MIPKGSKVTGQAIPAACKICSKPPPPGICDSDLICPFHKLRMAGWVEMDVFSEVVFP